MYTYYMGQWYHIIHFLKRFRKRKTGWFLFFLSEKEEENITTKARHTIFSPKQTHTWNMSGAFTNSTMARAASSFNSFKVCDSSPENVARYLVRNWKDSFAELKIQQMHDINKMKQFNPTQNIDLMAMTMSYLLLSLRILEIVRKSSLWSLIPRFHSIKKLSIFLKEGNKSSVTFPLTAKLRVFMYTKNRLYGFSSIL